MVTLRVQMETPLERVSLRVFLGEIRRPTG